VFGMQSLKSKANIRHVAVYGQKNGQARRWELAGTPEQLKQALKIGVKHPPKERFPRYSPFPNVVLGDWDDDVVKMDWDERSITDVKRFSFMLNNRYKISGFIILQSSTKTRKVWDEDHTRVVYKYKIGSFHTIFDKKVSWNKLIGILAWLCLYVKDEKLSKWFKMQLIKGTFTLRVGFKKRKKPPRIVYRFGNQDGQIARFLANRKFILDFLEETSCSRISTTK
jgi:hypothetical protein